MKDKRREILLGYLLGALEPHESAKVDVELETNDALRQDLSDLYREISPINEIVDHHEHPVGLAERTCKNLWDKIDSPSFETSEETNVTPSPSKKRRATAVFTQSSQTVKKEPKLTKTDEIVDELIFDAKTQAVDVPIPLSQAVRLATDGSLNSQPLSSAKMIRRIDETEPVPAKPELHRIFAEASKSDRGHQPKHYGRKTVVTKTVRRPWSVRDVFASLLVGLTAAVLIFPIIQMGIGNFRDMIIHQKLQTVARNMAPNTSQYSPYGLSQSDLRALAHMNIDPQSATLLHNQQATATERFAVSPKMNDDLPQMPVLVPASISFPASNESFRGVTPDALHVVPDFLTVIDNLVVVSPLSQGQYAFFHPVGNDSGPLAELPEQDIVEILLIKELINHSCLPLAGANDNATWHSPGCNFIKTTSYSGNAPTWSNSSDVFSSFP